MRSYRIYLYRHGLTQGNLEGRYVGSTDLPLCEESKTELEQLAKEKEYPFVGKVYVSSMQRCIQTAEILYPGVETVSVEKIKEYDFGIYENKTADELKEDPDFIDWIRSNMAQSPKGGEDIRAFGERIREGFDEIVRDMMAKKISSAAVVTHGGVIMSLLSMCGLPKMQPTNWNAEPGTGYALLVNASLWGNTGNFEICERIPYTENENFTEEQFAMLDADELRRELREENQ